MKPIALALLCCAVAHAAEISLPDTCNSGLCFTDLRWKKGTLEHTLVGFVGPETGNQAQSVSLAFAYTDGKSNGTGTLNLRNVATRTPFYFKVNWRSVKWDGSTVTIKAAGIMGITSIEKDGVACTFSSLGSRLAVSIKNGTPQDLILDYQLLTLTSGGNNLKLNGSHGKYVDQHVPNAPTLIGAGSTQNEEIIAVGSAHLDDGWVEDWRLHEALLLDKPTLTLPLGAGVPLSKIPLEVHAARIASTGTVPAKTK